MEHHWVAVEAFQQRTSWFHRGKCQEMISHRDTPFGNINEDAKNCAPGHRAGLSYISSDVKTLMCWQNKTKSQLFFHTSNFYHSFYVHVHHSFTETCPCQKAEHKCYSLTCSFNWMQFSATWPGHSYIWGNMFTWHLINDERSIKIELLSNNNIYKRFHSMTCSKFLDSLFDTWNKWWTDQLRLPNTAHAAAASNPILP